MSSHHFVREDQEPALFITGSVNQKILLQLLEWSPKVIVVQEAVELIVSLGVKIDVVLCEAEVYDHFQAILSFQMPIQFILVDDSSTGYIQQGLSFLKEQNHKAVHLLGETSSEEMAQMAKLAPFDIVIWSNDRKWSCCRSGQFSKWVTGGSVFILDKDEDVAIHTGVDLSRHETQDHNAIKLLADGMITFQKNGLFWLGEHID